MAKLELLMPKMGESIMEATILKWLKKEGDAVEMDEAILEIATDKVDSEVPAPEAGILGKTLFAEGDTVEVGKIIAYIQTEGEAGTETSAPATSNESVKQPAVEVVQEVMKPLATPVAVKNNGSSNGRFYSPLVLNIARTENISMAELETLAGSGSEGRVTKKDILGYVKNRTQPSQSNNLTQTLVSPSNGHATASKQQTVAATSASGNVEIVEMDRMRRLIADHMVMSKKTSPHVTSFVEADVTNLVNWRNKIKNSFAKREGQKITFTPIFVEAIVKAIKDFPNINVSVEGNNVLVKKDINIGIATALPSGNLIVPVIKNADQLSLLGITTQLNAIVDRARNNKLKPDDIQGGTYTLTNVGTFGNVMGTPIINQPQVAIMAAGAIRKKPAVVETEYGDLIAVRQMMFLSHAYDHRVVDGALGGQFVRRVADYLESFDVNREI